jgi:hypothetical protein
MYNVLWKSDIFSGIGPGTKLRGLRRSKFGGIGK